MADFDINNAFLHVPLDSPPQLIMQMPPEINHPLAGQWVEVLKSIYGLKQSNSLTKPLTLIFAPLYSQQGSAPRVTLAFM
jgi:hypothetical protein